VEQKLPNAHEIREFVQLGGLLSYGALLAGSGQPRVDCASEHGIRRYCM
jgi:hypothetical protein